jgi:hypothetical protein
MPHGEQLKFAVGESGVNESGMLDEIIKDVEIVFEQDRNILGLCYEGEMLHVVKHLNNMYSILVLETIKKYRNK